MHPMASGGDLSLTILGFLHERPMHGYELKSRLTALTGHLRPVSDGALYPAISRLEGKGLVERHEEAGAAAARRQVLTITPAGREELLRRLREPADLDISDQSRFFALLTFLSALPDPADQAAVLRHAAGLPGGPGELLLRGRQAGQGEGRAGPVPARHAQDRPRRQPGRARMAP